MTEKVLNIVRRQSKKIFCIFDGLLFQRVPLSTINILIQQIEELGSIRKNIVIFSRQLESEEYDSYIKTGISPNIVSSERDIHFTIECMEAITSYQVDLLCLGIVNETLLPLVIDLRAKTDILIVAPTKKEIENYEPYLDFSIAIDQL